MASLFIFWEVIALDMIPVLFIAEKRCTDIKTHHSGSFFLTNGHHIRDWHLPNFLFPVQSSSFFDGDRWPFRKIEKCKYVGRIVVVFFSKNNEEKYLIQVLRGNY